MEPLYTSGASNSLYGQHNIYYICKTLLVEPLLHPLYYTPQFKSVLHVQCTVYCAELAALLLQDIFAKIGPDLEIRGGDLISAPVDRIVSLVSPKKSNGPNSVGKNYFSATPFFTFNQKCNRWP